MSDEITPSPLANPSKSPLKLTEANAETDARLAPASPTGTAVLGQWLVRIGLVVAGLASTILAVAASGVALPAWLTAAATTAIGLLAALGIASPGVRKTGEK